jgi:hypothetical protein
LLGKHLVTAHGLPVTFIPDYTTEAELYVPAIEGFREYRQIFEDLHSLITEDDPKRGQTPTQPPAIPQLCQDCKEHNLSLYNLIEQKLKPYVNQSEMPHSIAGFLMYDYKTLLFVLSYRKLKKDRLILPSEEWSSLYLSTIERLQRLEWKDASLEPKMPEYFIILLSAEREEGEKAIRIIMEYVKWHVVREISVDPRVDKKVKTALQDFEDEAMPIVDKARQKTTGATLI